MNCNTAFLLSICYCNIRISSSNQFYVIGLCIQTIAGRRCDFFQVYCILSFGKLHIWTAFFISSRHFRNQTCTCFIFVNSENCSSKIYIWFSGLFGKRNSCKVEPFYWKLYGISFFFNKITVANILICIPCNYKCLPLRTNLTFKASCFPQSSYCFRCSKMKFCSTVYFDRTSSLWRTFAVIMIGYIGRNINSNIVSVITVKLYHFCSLQIIFQVGLLIIRWKANRCCWRCLLRKQIIDVIYYTISH